jgi:beta-glucanase (GH16 family)
MAGEVEVGDAVLNHGTVDETWGTCENISVAPEADKKELPDGKGDVKGLLYTKFRKKVSGEYTPMSGATDPVTKADIIGSRLTLKTEGVDTIEIVVDGAEIKYKKGDVTTWSVNGYYYPELPAAT